MAVSTALAEILSLTIRLLTFEVLHHTYREFTYLYKGVNICRVCTNVCQGTRLHKAVDLLKKRRSLVGFPGPPTCRDVYIPIRILMFLTGQYIVVHIHVCNTSKLRARHHRVSAFPYCFNLAPLTSSDGLSRRFL